MQDCSAAVGVQLDASAAASVEHMQEFNSHSADHQAAAARLHDACVLAEQPVNKQNMMPTDLALAGKAKVHEFAKLSAQSEQHGHLESMQPENRLHKSSGSQSQAQPVSDNAKQSEQLPQQQQSSMQAHQACSMQPGQVRQAGPSHPPEPSASTSSGETGPFPWLSPFSQAAIDLQGLSG